MGVSYYISYYIGCISDKPVQDENVYYFKKFNLVFRDIFLNIDYNECSHIVEIYPTPITYEEWMEAGIPVHFSGDPDYGFTKSDFYDDQTYFIEQGIKIFKTYTLSQFQNKFKFVPEELFDGENKIYKIGRFSY